MLQCPFVICFGVSASRQTVTSGEISSPNFFANSIACAQVEGSATVGPEAIISTLSPKTSDRMIVSTFAGKHHWANRPPFTAERCLRIVLIWPMSIPARSIRSVISFKASSEINGLSKSALPPPESKNRTVSVAFSLWVIWRIFCVPSTLFRSGMGCPASKHKTPGSFPRICPYFVSTIPRQIGFGTHFIAASAICHAAFPTATR